MLVAVFSSCTNSTSPVQITRLYPLMGCAASEDDDGTFLAGSAIVDVAAGAPRVLVGVEMTGQVYSTPGLALRTGETLEPKQKNFPVFTDVVLTYRLSRRLGGTLKPYDVPISLTAGGTADSLKFNGAVQLISPELGDQLTNGLSGSTSLDDFVDIDVDIEFRGEINSSRTPITTGAVTFPVRAVKSAPAACPAGLRYARYPFRNAAGGVDFCRYVGSSFDGSFNAYYLSPVPAPPDPAKCCDPNSPTAVQDGC
jgi:hypothetical protein